MTKPRIAFVAVLLLALTPWAFAGPFNPFNTRPVSVNPAPGIEQDLQEILDDLCGVGCLDVINDQQTAGYWKLASYPGSMTPTLVIEWAGWRNINVFGMFSGDPAMHDIFLGPASAGATATVTWTTPTSGTITGGSGVNAGPFSGISYLGFGFYIKPKKPEGAVYYTVDDLNPGGVAQALVYRLPDADSGNTWVIAFEDQLRGPGDEDYNDLVVTVGGIVPVPEPAGILLLGSALLLLARKLRARA